MRCIRIVVSIAPRDGNVRYSISHPTLRNAVRSGCGWTTSLKRPDGTLMARVMVRSPVARHRPARRSTSHPGTGASIAIPCRRRWMTRWGCRAVPCRARMTRVGCGVVLRWRERQEPLQAIPSGWSSRHPPDHAQQGRISAGAFVGWVGIALACTVRVIVLPFQVRPIVLIQHGVAVQSLPYRLDI